MNRQSYNILEDVISKSGIWTALEVVGDSIYLDFEHVQLYNPSEGKCSDSIHDSRISIRFADNSLFSILYNDKEDIGFLKNTHGLDNNFLIEFSKKLDCSKFKFQNLGFINDLYMEFENELIFLDNFKDESGENVPDFILSFTSDDIAICVGGNSLNVFNDFESLSDYDILELSNKWVRYYLEYWRKKGTELELPYDPLCEESLLDL
ncbi:MULTISPECIES: hypothetical protein [Methanobrevibacter]|uniref:hypothetical protein n=1 Tax=Methanobrevibacter TaxID=2172 RepID=UPI00033483C0|nr:MULTISPECIES: hypothetical protein [Methanobrevibacter]AGN17100.1 hypothetical protein Abm4_1217 [Methanobrevibacter sp. AbM4]MDD6255988.1 hypothetical protein [Methanobrevibacter boviskoreani]